MSTPWVVASGAISMTRRIFGLSVRIANFWP